MYTVLILSISISLVPLLVFSTGEVEESLTVVSPPAKIRLHHAINTLEEVVKEEKIIQGFCYKYFNPKSQKELPEDKKREQKEECRNQIVTKISTKGSTEIITNPWAFTNCADLFKAGIRTSGIYTVYLKSTLTSDTRVYCDMESEGWTVIQRRGEFPKTQPRLNFTRSWKEYAVGFGNFSEEFWLGNDNIHLLTTQNNMSLRVELKDFDNNITVANYKLFYVGNEKDEYALQVDGFNGSAGDSLSNHNGYSFHTYDREYGDRNKKLKGGWWFGTNQYVNLNGEYLRGKHNEYDAGVNWYKWTGSYYSLKECEMKIRPTDFIP